MDTTKQQRTVDTLFDAPDGLAQLFVLCGKSGRGKSYFVRYLLTDMLSIGKLKFGLVFTRTKFNGDYKFIPDKRVIEGYNEDILKKYVNNLRAICEKEGSIAPNFLIFDDLIGVLNNQTQWFSNFMSIFRHTNTTIFICAQYLMGRNAISPLMREQTNYCVMFQSRTKRTLENLFETYGGLFECFKDFKEYFLNATSEKYSAMLYSERIDFLEDNYQTIMAPDDYPKLQFKF
jgi:hypothetical protein